LADEDWLYGGSAETIVQSIANGRAGVMPNLGLDETTISILAHYVKHLAGSESVSDHVKRKGPQLFQSCAACHGVDASGNPALGAPNLTDNIWLHGRRISDIENTLRNGRQGNMPSFKALLSEDEIRLLAAYVLSLSQGDSLVQ
jgi:cytochrome c oxidase cbb3-type subunit 3